MPRRTRSATRESADDEAPDEFDQASAKQSALEAAEREEAAQAAQAAKSSKRKRARAPPGSKAEGRRARWEQAAAAPEERAGAEEDEENAAQEEPANALPAALLQRAAKAIRADDDASDDDDDGGGGGGGGGAARVRASVVTAAPRASAPAPRADNFDLRVLGRAPSNRGPEALLTALPHRARAAQFAATALMGADGIAPPRRHVQKTASALRFGAARFTKR